MMEKIIENIDKKWLNIIYSDETKKLLDSIIEKLKNVSEITPTYENIFSWCRYTNLDDIKVIIIGQDPYHKIGWAHGLSFSSLGNVIPPSLKNIYACLKNNNLINEIPKHADLTSWATQGVLLLNASLTTIISKAGAHMKIWDEYTKLIIKKICDYHEKKKIIFLLWGKFAQNYENIISEPHIVMKSIHPSPLAQRVENSRKFINCTHFNDVNEILSDKINWSSILGEKNMNEITTIEKKNMNEITPIEEKIGIRDDHIIAFTDGSTFPNDKSKNSRGGYAILFVSGCYKDMCLYGNLNISKYPASNIRAEGTAILYSLKKALESDKCKELTIFTDCQFWINMIYQYMPNWSKEKFKEKNNYDLTKSIWKYFKKVSKKIKVHFTHIRSHNKNGWKDYDKNTYEYYCYKNNDYVDKLCNHARKKLNPNTLVFKKIMI